MIYPDFGAFQALGAIKQCQINQKQALLSPFQGIVLSGDSCPAPS